MKNKEFLSYQQSQALSEANYDGQRTTSDCGADKEFSEEYYNETFKQQDNEK